MEELSNYTYPDTDIILLTIFICSIVILYYLVTRVYKRIHSKKTFPQFFLSRARCNPLLAPDQHWEESGTFNAGVHKDERGFHIFYRAIGSDGVSRVGYAHSPDGHEISHRLPYPIFSLQYLGNNIPQSYSLKHYPSGGSWGGCEDPRIVRIEDRMYMTFNAFQGWDSIRIGVVSISVSDFEKGNWKWGTPLLISSEYEQNKNWVLFPEKFNGKYAIIHSITPTVLIDYVDSLEELAYGTSKITSRSHPQQGGRAEYWDNRIRGAGPPPLKTSKGWLLLYHAISSHESHKYKIGALLLDLNNPEHIIARSPSPLLVPDEWYENDSKPGIVYTCGATIHDDTLSVFYGGGDKYMCVAQAPVSKLLSWLITYGSTK